MVIWCVKIVEATVSEGLTVARLAEITSHHRLLFGRLDLYSNGTHSHTCAYTCTHIDIHTSVRAFTHGCRIRLLGRI